MSYEKMLWDKANLVFFIILLLTSFLPVFCLPQLLWSLPNSCFIFPPCILYELTGMVLNGRMHSFPFLYSFTYINMNSCIDVWFIILAVTCSYCYLFCCSRCPLFGHWELLQIEPYILYILFHHFLSISLLSGTPKCSKNMYFPFLILETNYFCKKPWFL